MTNSDYKLTPNPFLTSQFFDTDHDRLLNFRDFALGLGMMHRGEMNDRLRLLYELHLPPALLPEDLESPTGDTQTGNKSYIVDNIF